MMFILVGAAVLAALQLGFVVWNLGGLRRIGNLDGRLESESTPRLSVLIPARNEAAQIEDCLESVLSQEGSLLEVLVLDDLSEDGTADKVRALAERDPRVRLLTGKPLPVGWTGKCFACHQLAEQASGDWFLFLDADARLEKGALRLIFQEIQSMERDGKASGMVSGFPRQIVGSWLERLVVPMMAFAVACHLPIRLVRGSRSPRFAAAHGGFILIHRSTYAASGGHRAIKGALVDDVQLARAVKTAGHSLRLVNVNAVVCMRMYRNAHEVWQGYRKNIFPGLGRNRLLLSGVVLWYAFLNVVPLIGLLGSVFFPQWLLPALAAYVMGAAAKESVDRLSGIPIWISLLIPFSALALIGIALDSMITSVRQTGYEWKGRRYG